MTLDLARAALDAARVDEPQLVPRHGWANETWIGDRFVVRLSNGRLRGSLTHEAEVVERLEGSIVPVARAVAHGRVSDLGLEARSANVDAEWLISERLPGDTLATYWPDLPTAARRAVGAQLGSILRAVHATPGPSEITPTWWRDACDDPAQLHNAYRPPVSLGARLVIAAREAAGADDALLDDVDALLHERLGLFDHDVHVLLHTDVHAHNVLVSETSAALTGLLDWEGAHAGPADVELDMLLRYVAAADAFPERPGARIRIAPGDMLELVDHVATAYPELFAVPRLRERLEVYDAHWHLLQILVNHRLQSGARAARDPAWERLGHLLDGASHLRAFGLGD